MNKVRILLFLLITAIRTDYPASLAAQDFRAGVFGGMTFSQVDGDFYGGYKKLGLTGGTFVNREIFRNTFGQMEIKYVSRGAYENNWPDQIYRSVYRYIELPLSLHYLYRDKYQPELGLSPEVLIHYASFDAFGITETGLAGNRRFGLSAFAGFTYWFLPNTGAGLRFTYSVIRFRKPEEWNNFLYRGYFHNVFSLSIYQRILPR